MVRRAVINRALKLPRAAKRLVALSLDAMICVLSVWLSFYLRLGEWPPMRGLTVHPVLGSIAIALPIFVSFGLYRAIFRYAGWEAMSSIVRAVALYAVAFSFIYTVVGVTGVPRTLGLIQPMLLLIMVGASRVVARLIFAESYTALWRSQDLPRVLIYGAGSAGRELAAAIAVSKEMHLVGFIDDDASLTGSVIRGVPILSSKHLPREVQKRSVSDILLALPSVTRKRRSEILDRLRELGIHVRTVSSMVDLARGELATTDIKELEIEDLLGRETVPPDANLLRKNLAGKTVMVTGAGGSIGSELCRQIINEVPDTLLLVELSEYNLYAIHGELQRVCAAMGSDAPVLVPLIASVTDTRRMEEIFATWRPSTVLHAAAYKHVPIVEHNPVEGIRNNVFGTLVTATLAKAYDVENFVLISTDKAVRPTNIMGATKRVAEMILQATTLESGQTCFSMVRFGNVLGSSGSVVPLFRAQIAAGGPVTITHPEITRYFMTIPEAAQLVLQAGAMAAGGDVFVLDMGEPVRIVDLALNMIKLSGLSVRDKAHPSGDIELQVTGLRPGEKLYEELLIGNDPIASEHPRILRAKEQFLLWEDLNRQLNILKGAIDTGDAPKARSLLRELVPEFEPQSELVDLVFQRSLIAC